MIYLDFEGRSELDLLKVGTYRYARHPSSDVMCMSYAFDDREVERWHPAFEDLSYLQAVRKVDRLHDDLAQSPEPEELLDRIASGEEVEAHNAFFERNLWLWIMVEKYGFRDVDFDQWRCSAAVCGSFALPRKLEKVAAVLGLSQQKDAEGHRLMLKMCKPRKPTKGDPDSKWHQKRTDLDRLFEYCDQDVRTERAVSKALRSLKGDELEVWKLDQRINLRGLHLDKGLCEGAMKMGAIAEKLANEKLDALSEGAVTGSTKRSAFKEWMRTEGVTIPVIQKKKVHEDGSETMEDKETTGAEELRKLLKAGGLADFMVEAIEVWLAVNKTSTKKYAAMIMRMSPDDRVREVIRYWAATTGRWAGSGIQPQNLPRNCPKAREMEAYCDDVTQADWDDLCMLHGADAIMVLLSSLLRGAITAAPGNDLLAADYSAVEARGTFWVADHDAGLKIFEKIDSGQMPGEDIYTWQASQILGRKVTKADDKDRQIWGKVPVLACGYQGSHVALIKYADKMGITIEEKLGREVVDGYRKTNWPVKEFWYEIGDCAVAAVARGRDKPAVTMKNGKFKFKVVGAFLHIQLPSKRMLSYYMPRLEMDDRFGKPKVVFMGYATYRPGFWTKCSTYGGKLTENVVQAICRDIMAEAMIRVEAAGYSIVLTVHDEILSEVREGFGDLNEFINLLTVQPEWAPGFPMSAEGWRRPRYGK